MKRLPTIWICVLVLCWAVCALGTESPDNGTMLPGVSVLAGHSDLITGVSFSPDGRLLASSSCDKTIRLWNVATRRTVRTLKGHNAALFSVAFDPTGQLLASGSADKTV